MYRQRTDRLLALLEEMGADGVLIHKPSNIRWLSGYTGEGLLLLTHSLLAIVTDFRYVEQAETQAKDFTVHMTTAVDTHAKVTAALVLGAGIKTLAFEDDYVTVKDLKELEETMPGVSYVPVGGKPEKLRTVKDENEIALIENACQITCRAFEHILGFIQPGRTELEVRFELQNAMYRYGAHNLAFDMIIATGANGALPHAIPGDRIIEKGHMVTLDFGARYGGYCADMTRTVAVGTLDDESRRVYDTVLEAQLRALDAIRPGVSCRDVDHVARSFIDNAGYEGRFGHGLGHSLGLDIHESPRFNTLCTDVLQPGIVMTNEPGIYLPGKCGCRIEDTVLVTEDGCKRLTTASKELIIL